MEFYYYDKCRQRSFTSSDVLYENDEIIAYGDNYISYKDNQIVFELDDTIQIGEDDSNYTSIKDILIDELNIRYLQPIRPIKKRNLIVDSYIIKDFTNYLIDKGSRFYPDFKLPTSAYLINRWIASLIGIPSISISDLCLMLGYDKRFLKELFNEVRKKRLNITLVGIGGFGMNFLSNLIEISEYINEYKIFKSLKVYEKDNLEYSNIIRMMSRSISVSAFSELVYLKDSNLLGDYFDKIDLLYNLDIRCLSYMKPIISKREYNEYFAHYNDIVIGAVDLKTRDSLYKSNIPFLCPIHNNNKNYLWSKPNVNTDLQIESYGLIDLSRFFLSMLKMTIEVLIALRDDKFKEIDTLVKEFQIDTIDCSKTSRTYNIDFCEITDRRDI